MSTTPPPTGMPGEPTDLHSPKPRTVCICGSMRFEREMRAVAVDQSLTGAIVLLPLVNMNHPHPSWSDPVDAERVKTGLDRLHLAKIDQAGEVLVVCPGGYIGESTRREVAYAQRQGKPVRFLSGAQTTKAVRG